MASGAQQKQGPPSMTGLYGTHQSGVFVPPLYQSLQPLAGSSRFFSSPKLTGVFRVTLLISSSPLLGPYNRTMPRALWWPSGGTLFLMSEVILYRTPSVSTSG